MDEWIYEFTDEIRVIGLQTYLNGSHVLKVSQLLKLPYQPLYPTVVWSFPWLIGWLAGPSVGWLVGLAVSHIKAGKLHFHRSYRSTCLIYTVKD